MASPLFLTITDKIDKIDDVAVREGLNGYYDTQGTALNWIALGIFLRDEQGVLVGGLTGGTYWGWLYVARLWIEESARRQGLGTRLMRTAEEEAARRGCHHAYLDTHDALAFYQRLGYNVYGKLDGMPIGRTRYSLQKSLK